MRYPGEDVCGAYYIWYFVDVYGLSLHCTHIVGTRSYSAVPWSLFPSRLGPVVDAYGQTVRDFSTASIRATRALTRSSSSSMRRCFASFAPSKSAI